MFNPDLVRGDLPVMLQGGKQHSSTNTLYTEYPNLWRSLLYTEYGLRKNRSYQQKIAMFEVFYDVSKILPEPDITSRCISFSDDHYTVILFIKWFCQRGSKIGIYDLMHSFHKFGTQLFWIFKNTLLDSSTPAYAISYTIQLIIISKTQPFSEKKRALQMLKSWNVRFDSNVFNAACLTGNFAFCKWLIGLGVELDMNNLRYLFFESDKPDFQFYFAKFVAIDLYLKIEFVQECIKLVLAHTSLEIPFFDSTGQEYYNRSKYAFGGKIYDWLCATQPIMQSRVYFKDSVFDRPEHITTK